MSRNYYEFIFLSLLKLLFLKYTPHKIALIQKIILRKTK
ncbi:hypothetical protein BSF41_25820 [Flavobacterium sp. ACN2]|nr:hypothetical protein BSF41_25820 [Flavobacterium sp. ACN2]